MEKETDERIGIAVLRFSDEQVWRIWRMWCGLLSFIFEYENTPQPSQEGS
jgi:hypothetical protein